MADLDPTEAGAGEVTATVIVRAPAAKVYTAFMSWDRQGEWIPFTRVRSSMGTAARGR